MGDTRRTWWVKLRRAKQHLLEFENECARLRDGDYEYDVSVEVQSNENGNWLIVRGHLRPFSGDDDLAAIVGDVVANTRDALDHMETVLTGRDEAHFPIITHNIWESDVDTTTGKDCNKSGRNGFTQNTRGVPSEALALIKRHQPWVRTSQFPQTQPLAILQRLSNADKHRTLHAMSGMIYNAETVIEVDGFDPLIVRYPRQGMDGAIIATIPFWPVDVDPQVHAHGGLEITLQEAPGKGRVMGYWEMPSSLRSLVEYVENEIVRPLDALIG